MTLVVKTQQLPPLPTSTTKTIDMKSQPAKDQDSDSENECQDIKEGSPTFAPLKLDKAKLRQVITASVLTFEQDMIDTQSAVHLFLNSRVKDAETFLVEKYCKTLPHTLGYGVILSLKCLMTLDRHDIDAAMDALHITVEVAQVLRKEQTIVGSLTGFVFGGGRGGKDGLHFMKMTRIQRHAEVVFAEAYLLQAVLSLLTDTNMVTFVREGLNIRQAYSIFKSGFLFLERVWDEEGSHGLISHQIDQHFINAVYHGIGTFNLVLSVLPARLINLFEMIGFSGNRQFGMRCLELGGNWPDSNSTSQPTNTNLPSKSQTTKNKKFKKCIEFKFPDGKQAVTGVRSFLCDLSLHMYHIVLSSMIQMPGCNVPLSRQVLTLNLQNHPDSFLYLTLQARLLQSEAKPDQAIIKLNRVIDIQNDWRQLAHICFWDLGMCHAALGNWKQASECYKILFEESTWSPAIYLYLQAAFLYMHDAIGCKQDIETMLKQVPKLCKKVAGKSIPLEKFVSRKSRKYFLQGKRLLLPGYEIMYMWNGFDHVPSDRLVKIQIEVDAAIQDLDLQLSKLSTAIKPSVTKPAILSKTASQVLDKQKDNDMPYDTYYDDVCLTRLFKGLVLREQAFPTHLTFVPESFMTAITQERIGTTAQTATPDQQKTSKQLHYSAKQFDYIALIADQVHLDHWILPFARYELAQIYVRIGEYEKAKREYSAALNGGYADDEVGHRKRKASMENSLHLRVHNGLSKLKILDRMSIGVEDDEDNGNESS
ncbi:hypothetical protein QVD99_006798 [Batrachochytrium dendrobatidis]|nr:hypothetical protein O5D80_005223 [Batrachochytrium dendrobatidis]KAK5666737.1 hypothetical protein QVD99_006798 [Batrachochytrium dendrobatidis]